jgi:hypothetical protein
MIGVQQSCNAQKVSREKENFKHNEQYKMQPYVNPPHLVQMYKKN